ncbi:multiple inositol polyphosphate phosphatase 1-like [Culicoides brevitarsis]|uniref:multiple inositol polyphosphate phosphatase 1-like n=1 Tax=Culicoides brevitarsis TaxID=469753 RepID=UPI00307CB8C1
MTPKISLPLLLLLAFVCLLLPHQSISQQCCEDYCYSSDRDKTQVLRFATKTAYEFAKGAQTNNDYYVPNCEPKKIWILSRHGTRYPSAKEMKQMEKLQNLRDEILDNYDTRRSKPDQGALCDGDLAGFRNWEWDSNITAQYDNFLVWQGWEDLRFLAKSFQRRFPNILGNYYEREKYAFRYTDTERTLSSYRAFTEGLFGPKAYLNINTPPPPANDSLLKFYDMCPAFEEQSDKAKGPGSEYQKFIDSKVGQKFVSDVSMRLGFKFNLSLKQIDTIWDMCRYEQAWHLDKYSAWCSAFTKSQVEVMEYLEDIKYYYKQGYGNELNSNLACSLAQDLLMHMGSDKNPSLQAYFAHSSTIQLFLTALGVAKDRESLRADNFDDMKYRHFRTSKIGPFATNIAAVKYDCPRDAEPNKIMFYLNEKPVNFEWCKVGLCEYSALLRHLKRFQHADCNSFFCGGNGASGLYKNGILLVLGAFGVVTLWNAMRN